MSTDFSIDKFTSKLSQGGALASLFKAEMNRAKGQASGAVSESFGFLCKASNFPTSSIDVTEINYMGRPIRIPGNRAAQDWTTTIYNDEDLKIRGHGDLLGFQQSGMKDVKLADPVHHEDLFNIANLNIKNIENNENNFKKYEFLIKLFDKADVISEIN